MFEAHLVDKNATRAQFFNAGVVFFFTFRKGHGKRDTPKIGVKTKRCDKNSKTEKKVCWP